MIKIDTEDGLLKDPSNGAIILNQNVSVNEYLLTLHRSISDNDKITELSDKVDNLTYLVHQLINEISKN
jgi:hypothetical protein